MVKLKDPQRRISSKHIKSPHTSDAMPCEKRKPLFSFEFIDSQYCVSRCEKNDKAALADQLRLLGTQTWAELRQGNRHKTGYEKIHTSAIKPRIPPHLKNDDSVTFIAFRFSGMKPMIGYRIEEVFHIIWVDRDFSVYEH